jgi:hypothetical protein
MLSPSKQPGSSASGPAEMFAQLKSAATQVDNGLCKDDQFPKLEKIFKSVYISYYLASFRSPKSNYESGTYGGNYAKLNFTADVMKIKKRITLPDDILHLQSGITFYSLEKNQEHTSSSLLKDSPI